MRQALEALESCKPGDWSTGHVIHPFYDEQEVAKAITAIREVLVQPEYNATSDHRLMENAQGCMRCNTPKKCALYGCSPLTWPAEQPAVPERKPLTDEELRVIENKINPNMRWRSSDEEGITLYPQEYYELVRAIEAAHGIKGDA